MGKGRLMGFISKAANLVGTVIPGAAVAGSIAGKAASLMKDKSVRETLKKEQKKANEKTAKVVGSMLGGSSAGMAKFQLILSDTWEFIKKNWYIVLPAAIALIWILFFKKKSRGATRRRGTRTPISSTRRRAARRRVGNGSAWAAKMLKARRAKARSRKR